MSIHAKLYERPNGKHTVEEVQDIRLEDELYLKEKKIEVSFEDCGATGFVMYFKTGRVVDGEDEELTVLAEERTCRDTISDGVTRLKKLNI